MKATATEAMAALRAAHDAFADCNLETLTRPELLEPYGEYEALTCALPTQSHRMLARLQAETTAGELGAKSWNEALRILWRLSTSEAGLRLAEAADLASQRTLTGVSLDPVLPAVAAAQAAGAINGEHVKVLRDTMRKIAPWVDIVTRGRSRSTWSAWPSTSDPRSSRRPPHCACSSWTRTTPNPTMRNANAPADDEPCTAGTPTQTQIDDDHRTVAQRRHDAMLVIGRIALMTDLGDLNGLPVSIIIRTTLQDLESRAGVGVTGGGTIMPIEDVIRLGGHANHHLAVFDGATGSALNHFRAKRVATPAQRIMLIARDGGCTKPCCAVGAYGSQVHHAVRDWVEGGNTNVDEMALACGLDNRAATDGGYRTSINVRGECEWAPPEHLDNGQARVNYFHRPEALLRPADDASANDANGDAISGKGVRGP